MIKHIVLFRLKKEMLQEEKVSLMKRFKQEIEALPNDIDFIRKIEVGLNVNPTEDFDIALYSEFDDMEDVMRYAKHPKHLAVAALLNDAKESRSCVDYEF